MNEQLPDVLKIADLAKLLRCSTRTIERRLRAKDNLPPRLPSIDASHRWARTTVEEWLKRPGTTWKSGVRRIA